MKVQNNTISSRKGFTLVEMLGVLAIIAILISVIAVGVLSAINRSRIVATTATLKNIETGVVGYVALPNSGGTLPLTEVNGTNTIALVSNLGVVSNSTTSANYSIDQVLISAGFLEKPVSWRIGTDGTTTVDQSTQPKYILSKRAFLNTPTGVSLLPYNRVECAAITSTTAPVVGDVASDTTFLVKPQFAIDGTTPLSASRVVFVVFKGVSFKDAQKLSQELNGALDNSELALPADGQLKGRFIYGAVSTANTVDAFYYIASF